MIGGFYQMFACVLSFGTGVALERNCEPSMNEVTRRLSAAFSCGVHTQP
jgi:hypothetical protein